MPLLADPPCHHPALPEDLKIRFFGATISFPSSGIPDPGDQAAKILTIANAVAAGAQPIFDIIDAALALKKVFDAVKSLDPIAIGNVLGDFFKLLDKLAKYLPPVAIPVFMHDVVKATRIYAEQVKNQVEKIIEEQSAIDVARERATLLQNESLGKVCDCTKENLDLQMLALQNNGAPLNRLIALINVLGALAGQDVIPPMTIKQNPAEAIAPLAALVETLRTIENVLPG